MVSPNRLLSQTPVSTFNHSRHLMQRLEHLARLEKLTIHTQTRLAYSISDAVLDSFQLQSNHLLVMETLEGLTLESQITCPIVKVKFGSLTLAQTKTWLVVLNAQTEIDLLLNLIAALLSLITIKESLTIYLCAIITPEQQEANSLTPIVGFLSSLSKAIIVSMCLKADSLKDGVKNFLSDHPCEVIVLNTKDETISQKLDVTFIFLVT